MVNGTGEENINGGGLSDDASSVHEKFADAMRKAAQGNLATRSEKLKAQNKLFVRDRIAYLIDEDTFVEDGLLANALNDELPADGVVTGRALVDGRPVCIVANDPTVKAGSWGARTVEKIIRTTELALKQELPIVWLVDSAGGRITDQVEMFPGRRGAGRIFYNQVRLSGKVPQVCCLFGPSAAGGAYVPAFCDVVFMVKGNASMYLGSPRMAEEVVGEKVSLEEMGGSQIHTEISGCADLAVGDDAEAIDYARLYLSYLPTNFRQPPPTEEWQAPKRGLESSTIPADEKLGYDITTVINGVIDDGSFFEIKPRFAPELVVGLARLEGNSVGIVANNPGVKSGVLFTDTADKATRFITLCNAFNVPLIFLADVPGFMIGTQVEQQGIIRHGAKMISAMAEATVPKICVVLRKCYGAGLYAMCGPAFEPDATLALPTAQIAIMGPEPAVNAVFFNKIKAIEDPAERERFVAEQQDIYRKDVDLLRLAADLVIDAVVQPQDLREELIRRIGLAQTKSRHFTDRHNAITPV